LIAKTLIFSNDERRFSMLLSLFMIGIGLIVWIILCYGYAFFKTKIRWFLLHSLRWIGIGQYFALLLYLMLIGVLPLPYGELIVVATIGFIIARKHGPMLRNTYTEGPYRTRDMLFFRIYEPAIAAEQGFFVPFHAAVDFGAQRQLRTQLLFHGAMILINCLILYGAFLLAD